MSLFDPIKPPLPADDYAGLRYYQAEAVTAVREALQTQRSALLVMATGLGKTQCFGALTRAWPGKVLIVAHRDELIDQARKRIEQMTGEWVEVEQGNYHAQLTTRIVVASVNTIYQKHRLERFGADHFGLLVLDECFPAGTLIDGRPIEKIQLGDLVSCVDHSTGRVTRRPVVQVRWKPALQLLRLHIGATAIVCTPNHPFFIQGKGYKGYVDAQSIVPGDLCCLRKPVREMGLERPEAADLFPRVQEEDLVGNYGAHESPTCIGEDDDEEPNAPAGHSREGEQYLAVDWAWPEEARWQRPRADAAARAIAEGPGGRVDSGAPDTDQDGPGQRIPVLLQSGPSASSGEGGDRGGRSQPYGYLPQNAGCEEGGVLVWARVDRVESVEPTDPGGTRVYNLEVEDCHTYFANGVLVHNCHHYVAPAFRKPLEFFSGAKVLGVTATPDRKDKLAMGQVFECNPFTMDIEDGIDAGYLAPIIGQRVHLDEIDLSHVKTTAGDLNQKQLIEAIMPAVEGVVKKTIELHPDRKAICFFPGVKNAEMACAVFNRYQPDSTCFLSGETPDDEREQIVRDFRKGRYLRLCNMQIATEGFDAPDVSLIVGARPTKSRSLYAQMVGRGTRVLPNTVEHIVGREGAAARRAAVAASAKPHMVVLDFVGNSGKHSLCTIEDVLGGKFTEDEREHARRKTGTKPVNTRQALQQAREEIIAAAKAVEEAKIKARVEMFNPFKVLDVDDITASALEQRMHNFQPVEQRQMRTLEKFGYRLEDLKGASKRQADKLIAESIKRTRAGLATYRQLKLLQRYGVTDRNITRQRATAAIGYLESVGWGHKMVDTPFGQVPGRVDPKRLQQLLRARTPGEEG